MNDYFKLHYYFLGFYCYNREKYMLTLLVLMVLMMMMIIIIMTMMMLVIKKQIIQCHAVKVNHQTIVPSLRLLLSVDV